MNAELGWKFYKHYKGVLAKHGYDKNVQELLSAMEEREADLAGKEW